MFSIENLLGMIVILTGIFLAMTAIEFIIRGVHFLCIQIYDYFHPFGWK